ncbi:MAG: radical SAM protein [Syntrophobacterales bacterium]
MIKRLSSGGVITNYYCTSACGHCLYGCSPRWKKDYIDRETLGKILQKIKSLGCNSIHVGGGEPFLNPDGLKMVVEVVRSHGVHLEYVETNSSWFNGKGSAIEILSSLKESGLSTLLISMSPFHNEHIPFYRVKGVIEACRETGINIFPWISEFYSEIDAFDDRATHALSEYEDKYGGNYLSRLPSRYWIHFGGRALKTFAEVYGTKNSRDIISANKGGCKELLDVSHFHLDLYGNYIPGLCSGLAIRCDDLGSNLSPKDYPLLTTLYGEGIAGLFDIATTDYGFQPSKDYLSKCDLCFDIRRYLALEKNLESQELQPKGIYENV